MCNCLHTHSQAFQHGGAGGRRRRHSGSAPPRAGLRSLRPGAPRAPHAQAEPFPAARRERSRRGGCAGGRAALGPPGPGSGEVGAARGAPLRRGPFSSPSPPGLEGREAWGWISSPPRRLPPGPRRLGPTARLGADPAPPAPAPLSRPGSGAPRTDTPGGRHLPARHQRTKGRGPPGARGRGEPRWGRAGCRGGAAPPRPAAPRAPLGGAGHTLPEGFGLCRRRSPPAPLPVPLRGSPDFPPRFPPRSGKRHIDRGRRSPRPLPWRSPSCTGSPLAGSG